MRWHLGARCSLSKTVGSRSLQLLSSWCRDALIFSRKFSSPTKNWPRILLGLFRWISVCLTNFCAPYIIYSTQNTLCTINYLQCIKHYTETGMWFDRNNFRNFGLLLLFYSLSWRNVVIDTANFSLCFI